MAKAFKDAAEPYAEEIYAAVGRALTAWSHIEESLSWIFIRTIISDPAAAVGPAWNSFWAVESFRGKINMVDAALKMRYAQEPECLAMWAVIYKRARQKSSGRNELAHGTVMNFGPPQHTYFVPSFHKNMMADLPRIIAAYQAGPSALDLCPEHRLTAQQVDHWTQGFKMFKIRLDRFSQRLLEMREREERTKT